MAGLADKGAAADIVGSVESGDVEALLSMTAFEEMRCTEPSASGAARVQCARGDGSPGDVLRMLATGVDQEFYVPRTYVAEVYTAAFKSGQARLTFAAEIKGDLGLAFSFPVASQPRMGPAQMTSLWLVLDEAKGGYVKKFLMIQPPYGPSDMYQRLDPSAQSPILFWDRESAPAAPTPVPPPPPSGN